MITIQNTKLINGDKRLAILQWALPLLKGIQFIVLWGSGLITGKNFVEKNLMEEGKKLNLRVLYKSCV